MALDWGSTTCRAWLLAGPDDVRDARTSAAGVLAVNELAATRGCTRQEVFAEVFDDLCGDWLARSPALAAIACGMVGSDSGWVDAGYRAVPADLATAADLTLVRSTGGATLAVLAGLRSDRALPDVMRGEETQVAGLVVGTAGTGGGAARTVVLPGTHSKWVQLRGTTVVDLTTFLTGELYALLSRRSVIGLLAQPSERPRWTAFEHGLDVAASPRGAAGLLGTGFSARSLTLAGRLVPDDVLDYLSGLVIGDEVRGALLLGAAEGAGEVTLCGEPALCERYRRALARVGIVAHPADDGAVRRGLWHAAVTGGLLEDPEAGRA